MSSANPTAAQRHLPLAGTYNVRDIGGYPTQDGRTTRWRTLFRADSLHRLPTPAQQTLLEHGVRTIIDLRRPQEAQAAANVFATSPQVAYHHISLMADTRATGNTPPPMVDLYRNMLDERQEYMAAALRTLSAPGGLPGLVHCTAGKDRTGLIIALVLGVLGVPAETIVSDYALSSQYLVGTYLDEARQRAEANGYAWASYQLQSISYPENMQTTLQHLNTRYGGIEAYVRTIGLEVDDIQRLRATLLA